jgi:parallel beta-helix repeat protein
MKIWKSNKILLCLLMTFFVFAVCLGTQVAMSQTTNSSDGNSVNSLISQYNQAAWQNYTTTAEQYGVTPSATAWNQALNPSWTNTTSIDQPSAQPQVASQQVSFLNPLAELGVVSLSGLSLLVLLVIPKFGKKLLKRKLLFMMILVFIVACGAFMAYRTFAQTNSTAIPATATYVVSTNGVNVWSTRYDGTVMLNETNAQNVIQNAIDATSNGGGGTVFIRAGTYNLNSTDGLYLFNGVKLVGEGYGSTILNSINNESVWGVGLYADYCEVQDMTVQHNGTGYRAGYGVASLWPWGVNCSKVLDCRIANWGTGIYTPAGTTDEFSGNIVENCVSGIYIIRCSSCVISNNIVSETDGNGITVQSSQDVVVAQNTIRNWGDKVGIYWASAIAVQISGSSSANSENIAVIGNTGIGGNFSTQYMGILLDGEPNASYTVSRCTVTGNTLVGVLGTNKACNGIYISEHAWMNNVQDCVISSNSIKNFMIGIQSAACENNAIVGNIVVENYYFGMELARVQYYNIIGNTVENNGQGGNLGFSDGIYLNYTSLYCLISGNICVDNQANATQRYGINEVGNTADYNLITGNIVEGNKVGGIHKSGPHTIVTNNLGFVTENSGTAVLPAGATSVTFLHGLAGTPTIVVYSWEGAFSNYTLVLYVNSFYDNRTGWTVAGTAPLLNYINPLSYVHSTTNKTQTGDWGFQASGINTGTINSVMLGIYCNETKSGTNYIQPYIYNGSKWIQGPNVTPTSTTYKWILVSVSSILNTWTKINNAKLYMVYRKASSTSGTPTICVDAAQLIVSYSNAQPPQSYWSANNTTITITASNSSPVNRTISWYAQYNP